MEKKQKKFRWVAAVIVVLLALIGLVAYLGYVIFRKDANAVSGTVELQLEIEEKVASGDVVNIELIYVNQKSVTIGTGDIEFFFPDGFIVQKMTPQPEEANGYLWNVKNVKPGQAGKIEITGQLVGEKDEQKELSAIMTYRPENFAQDFQVHVKKNVLITDSVISAELEAPKQAQAGQEFTLKATFKNTSTLPLQNVRLRMEYPKGFSYATSSRETYGEDDEWRLETLESDTEETLEVKGTLDGKSGDMKEFTFQVGLLELDNTFHAQIEKTARVLVVKPDLELSLEAPEFVEVGQELTLTVQVKNTSELDMKDVDVRLNLNGSLFTESEYSFKKIEKLAALETKEVTYTTTLKKKGSANQQLEVAAKVLTALVSGKSVEFGDQQEKTIKVQGSLTATAEGRYYDEDLTKLGSGPLPPVVGQKTTYLIRWNASSGINDIQNFSMSTMLPVGVTFESAVSSGVTVDASGRNVSSTQSVFAGQQQTELEFYVSVVPTTADVNKLLVLTESATASGTDSFTKEALSVTISRITSDLSNDEGASGKGVVQQAQ